MATARHRGPDDEPTATAKARRAAIEASDHLERSTTWNGLRRGDPVVVSGLHLRGATWEFRAHVLNRHNGTESIEVVGGRPGDRTIRSFGPDRILRGHRAAEAAGGPGPLHCRPAVTGGGAPAATDLSHRGARRLRAAARSDGDPGGGRVPEMATIVFFHAHPDDEAIATGGTMAELSDQGHRVVLVTATRGELGEIPDGLLGPSESLTERRMDELAEACRILGVDRQVFLDYLDSGMAGEASNDRPGSFAAADVDEAAGAMAAILDEERADVLVTYDEHGGYGHPDHVQVHRVGMRAAERAGTPVVYMATMNRDFVRALTEQASGSGWEPPEGSIEGADTMGEPASRSPPTST